MKMRPLLLIPLFIVISSVIHASDIAKGFASGTSYTNDPLLFLLASMDGYVKSFKEFESQRESLPEKERQKSIQRLILASEANIQLSKDFLKWLADLPSLSTTQRTAVFSLGKTLQQEHFIELQEAILSKQASDLTLQSLREIAVLYEKVLPSRACIQEYKSELMDQQKRATKR